jgi:hypothetical protein
MEEVNRGMRVVLLARDPAEVDRLRARVNAHAINMGPGECKTR